MKRTIAAISLSLIVAVGFIGCSGTEAPKSSASGDAMMKDGMKDEKMMKDDTMMKDDKMMKDTPK